MNKISLVLATRLLGPKKKGCVMACQAWLSLNTGDRERGCRIAAFHQREKL